MIFVLRIHDWLIQKNSQLFLFGFFRVKSTPDLDAKGIQILGKNGRLYDLIVISLSVSKTKIPKMPGK